VSKPHPEEPASGRRLEGLLEKIHFFSNLLGDIGSTRLILGAAIAFEKNFKLSPGSTGLWIESVFRSEKNTGMVFSELRELVGLPIEELSSSSKFPRVRKDLKRF
jgi:hypothetical protein